MPSSYATLTSFGFFLFVFWGWGELLPRALPAGIRLAAGLASCGIFATLAYEHDLAVGTSGRITLAIAAVGLIRGVISFRRSKGPLSAPRLFIPLTVAFMLLLPALIGGLQFS